MLRELELTKILGLSLKMLENRVSKTWQHLHSIFCQKISACLCLMIEPNLQIFQTKLI